MHILFSYYSVADFLALLFILLSDFFCFCTQHTTPHLVIIKETHNQCQLLQITFLQLKPCWNRPCKIMCNHPFIIIHCFITIKGPKVPSPWMYSTICSKIRRKAIDSLSLSSKNECQQQIIKSKLQVSSATERFGCRESGWSTVVLSSSVYAYVSGLKLKR